MRNPAKDWLTGLVEGIILGVVLHHWIFGGHN